MMRQEVLKISSHMSEEDCMLARIVFAAVVAIFFAMPAIEMLAQEHAICGVNVLAAPSPAGVFLPTTGTIRALVVYAKFPEDGAWPPENYQSIIDPTVSSTYTPWSMSDYYGEMSNGTLNVIGDVYPDLITLPNPQTSYTTFDDVNRVVLQWLIDHDAVDFADYDNWTFVSPGNHTNSPDGFVDMIIIHYPGMAYPLKAHVNRGNFTGICGLGDALDPVDVETNDFNAAGRIRICMRTGMHNGHAASGITIMQNWNDLWCHCHEFGHSLFGLVHYSGEGLMGPHFHPGMSSIERVACGYMSFTEVTTVMTDYTLGDMLTDNQALHYDVPGTENDLVIENHQRGSIYDGVGDQVHREITTNGTGVYILHHPSSWNNNIVETADGKWDWALDCTTPNPWKPSENASIWHQTDPNPVAGLNELERYKTFRSGACPATFDDYTGEEIGDDEDAFKIGYNELYSPWSNPRSRSTGIAVQLLSMIEGDATVRFFFSNPEDAPPAKPYRLVSSWSPADCDPVVDLSWTASTEPDMTDAGDPGSYRVWRSMNGADFTPVAMVTHPTTRISSHG
jgi:hypothetical protein